MKNLKLIYIFGGAVLLGCFLSCGVDGVSGAEEENSISESSTNDSSQFHTSADNDEGERGLGELEAILPTDGYVKVFCGGSPFSPKLNEPGEALELSLLFKNYFLSPQSPAVIKGVAEDFPFYRDTLWVHKNYHFQDLFAIKSCRYNGERTIGIAYNIYFLDSLKDDPYSLIYLLAHEMGHVVSDPCSKLRCSCEATSLYMHCRRDYSLEWEEDADEVAGEILSDLRVEKEQIFDAQEKVFSMIELFRESFVKKNQLSPNEVEVKGKKLRKDALSKGFGKGSN